MTYHVFLLNICRPDLTTRINYKKDNNKKNKKHNSIRTEKIDFESCSISKREKKKCFSKAVPRNVTVRHQPGNRIRVYKVSPIKSDVTSRFKEPHSKVVTSEKGVKRPQRSQNKHDGLQCDMRKVYRAIIGGWNHWDL